MQYSFIKDAWKIPSQPNIEYTEESVKEEKPRKPRDEYLFSETATMTKEDCEDLLRKVLKSEKCKRYLRSKYRPRILEKLYEILDENRDIIVLILIIYSLVLFFRLVY